VFAVRRARLGCSARELSVAAAGAAAAALALARGEIRWGGARDTVGMQPSRKREGKPVGEARGTQLGCSRRPRAAGNPLGRVRRARLGCSPRASARGNPLGRREGHSWDAAAAQGRREIRWGGCAGHGWDAALAQARGEIRWGGARDTVGMQPSRKREGKPVGEARGTRLGCSPRASARGNPLGRREGHSWDAALAQARGEIRWGGARDTVGMQPPPKGGGKSAGEGAGGVRKGELCSRPLFFTLEE
jgi:hypothetical protein